MRNNVAVAGARWFFPNGNQVVIERRSGPNDPYFKNNLPTPLIIQKFVHPYNGTYHCGSSSNFDNVQDTINLILTGMMIIQEPY